MKFKTLALVALISFVEPVSGAEAEQLALEGPAPAFQIAMVLDATSPQSLKSLKTFDSESASVGSASPDSPTRTLPHLLEGTLPSYPESARKSRVQTSLSVTGIIDAQGQLRDLEVESHHSQTMGRLFEASTLRALQDWSFNPGTVNEQAVPVSLQLTVRFKLINPSKRLGRTPKSHAAKTKGT